jgi:hypothetical protein
MVIQVFKTRCEDCGEELESRVGNMDNTNEVIIEFLDQMEFYCESCDVTTYIEVQKYTG